MEKENYNDDMEITYDGDFAGAVKKKGDYSVEKSLQLLNYMKGKGYRFVGTSSVVAYFVKEPEEINKKKK